MKRPLIKSGRYSKNIVLNSWQEFQVPKASKEANLLSIWLHRFICAHAVSIKEQALFKKYFFMPNFCGLWSRVAINGAITVHEMWHETSISYEIFAY